jgi:hypothetical protein
MTKPKRPEDKLPKGRPSKYSTQLGIDICNYVASSTDGMRKMCRNNEKFPCADTLMQWRLNYPDFSARYAQAKLVQADLFAEEIIDIIDDCETISDNVMKARAQVDARKWIACKLLPKAYGDKVQNETKVTITHEDRLKELL